MANQKPLGIGGYNGLAVPLRGESEIRQDNSSRTVLTVTHSTANTGRFVTLRDWVAPGSTAVGSEVAWITAAGRFVGPQISVISPTTGANYQVTSTQNGTLFNIGTNDGTSQMLLLPVNPVPGFWFKVYVSTQAVVGDFQINSTADSSAKIVLPGLTSAVSTADAIGPFTTAGNHIVTLTAISSILWIAEPSYQVGPFSTGAVQNEDLDGGRWSAATTIT